MQCKREEKKELFSELAIEYETEVGEKFAIAICQSDMFNEIAHRYFKAYDRLGILIDDMRWYYGKEI